VIAFLVSLWRSGTTDRAFPRVTCWRAAKFLQPLNIEEEIKTGWFRSKLGCSFFMAGKRPNHSYAILA
jgi:hypothetical protein